MIRTGRGVAWLPPLPQPPEKMTMKSKNAERLVIRGMRMLTVSAYLDDARKAVELAEEDARERAIEAFKKYIVKNSINCIWGEDKYLMEIAVREFKEKYDNERD